VSPESETCRGSGVRTRLEVAILKDQINFKGQNKLRLGVALWHSGLPVDVLAG